MDSEGETPTYSPIQTYDECLTTESHMSLTTYIKKIKTFTEKQEALLRSHLLLDIKLENIEHEYFINRERR